MFHQVTGDGDIQAVVKLARIIWPEHYTAIIGSEQVDYMLTHLHSEEAISRQIGAENFLYFLIKSDRRSIGYIGARISKNHLFLSKIYLLSSERGSGHGRAAMDFVRELAVKAGVEKITLTVNKHNVDTIGAYNSLGFVTTGEVCMDIGGGYVMDDFEMELLL
jgi:ribosomal protein S18 acetylase RimI-like enzyme